MNLSECKNLETITLEYEDKIILDSSDNEEEAPNERNFKFEIPFILPKKNVEITFNIKID